MSLSFLLLPFKHSLLRWSRTRSPSWNRLLVDVGYVVLCTFASIFAIVIVSRSLTSVFQCFKMLLMLTEYIRIFIMVVLYPLQIEHPPRMASLAILVCSQLLDPRLDLGRVHLGHALYQTTFLDQKNS